MRAKKLGNLGENAALNYLKKIGYKFVDRNVFSRYGEIDLIFIDFKSLVFVEVKTRWSHEFGSALEAVTPFKIKSITKTAVWYSAYNPKLPKQMRIDVIAIDVNELGQIQEIKHLKNVTG